MEKLKRIIFQMDYLKRQELFFPQIISILCYLAKRKGYFLFQVSDKA